MHRAVRAVVGLHLYSMYKIFSQKDFSWCSKLLKETPTFNTGISKHFLIKNVIRCTDCCLSFFRFIYSYKLIHLSKATSKMQQSLCVYIQFKSAFLHYIPQFGFTMVQGLSTHLCHLIIGVWNESISSRTPLMFPGIEKSEEAHHITLQSCDPPLLRLTHTNGPHQLHRQILDY